MRTSSAVSFAKLTHTFDSGVVAKEPTCTENGEKGFTCIVCGASELRVIEKMGHSYGEWVVIKAPTCYEEGLKERVCTNDSDGDGYCDDCGNDMQSSDRCKYCGKIHTGPFAWLVKLFHSIFALFKRK